MPADDRDEDEPRGPHGEPEAEWLERLRQEWESGAVLREWDEEAGRPWKDEEER